MTICAAAFAADMKAIVCVADRAISYGGYIQWDADSAKIIKLNSSGALVMISDEGNGQRVLTSLFEKADQIGGKKRGVSARACEDQYKVAVDDLLEASFLRPRFLDRKRYEDAIVQANVNDLLRSLADEIKAFDMNCDLLICGFDIDSIPFIFDVSSPGVVKDMTLTGFQAIGSGWPQAVSRLLFSEHERKHPIERVLYDCFDAKANAEMNPSVGYEWDAVVITKQGASDVPKNIKRIIEQVWSCHEQSPFDNTVDKDDVPPKTWKKILQRFGNDCLMPLEFRTLADQP